MQSVWGGWLVLLCHVRSFISLFCSVRLCVCVLLPSFYLSTFGLCLIKLPTSLPWVSSSRINPMQILSSTWTEETYVWVCGCVCFVLCGARVKRGREEGDLFAVGHCSTGRSYDERARAQTHSVWSHAAPTGGLQYCAQHPTKTPSHPGKGKSRLVCLCLLAAQPLRGSHSEVPRKKKETKMVWPLMFNCVISSTVCSHCVWDFCQQA